MALYKTPMLHGKSRLGMADKGKQILQKKFIELRNITENATFILPKNVALKGDYIVVNKSPNSQVAITIGTSAAGTQISAGLAVATGLCNIQTLVSLQPATTDRTIYVESAAWQTGVSVFIEAVELPVVADVSAIS